MIDILGDRQRAQPVFTHSGKRLNACRLAGYGLMGPRIVELARRAPQERYGCVALIRGVPFISTG
jgi:hypothetical protein